jgi:hypothetical protein
VKYYRRIDLRAEKCPRHVFDKVLGMAPDSLLDYGDIKIEAKAGDDAKSELVQEVLAFLRKCGLPWSRRSLPGTYGYEIVRKYELPDLFGARFLLLDRQQLIQLEDERDEEGRLLLNAQKARPSRKIGTIDPNHIIVSDATRKLMASGTFIGSKFAAVALKGKSAKASPDPFWELKSSLTLPKMSNTDRFVTVGSVPFDADYSKMVWIDDPPFRSGEIHYKDSHLKALGDFDMANTLEYYNVPHPALIISQRLYQHCVHHKIPLTVEPVRIDPG